MRRGLLLAALLIAIVLLFGVASVMQAQSQLGSDIDGEAAVDVSGSSVSLSSDGSRVATGAPLNDGTANDAGHIRVYEWGGMRWTQLGLDIDGEAAGDNSGVSVALSSDGTRVAVGACDNGGTGSFAGHVRVYSWDDISWTQLGADIDGEAAGDHSGISVSLSSDGSRLAVGAPYNDSNYNDAGHVRVYEWDGATWTQLGVDIDGGEAANDLSGISVSLSSDGSRVAVGAPYNDGTASDAGHVRVYGWDDISWTQLGADIDGETAGDRSGSSVSLSSDGNRVVVGAPWSDSTETDAGQIRIYEWDGLNWTQLGADIDGESNNGHGGGSRFGSSVSLASDGSRVAVGAPNNRNGSGNSAGHTRVYEWDGTNWIQQGVDIDGEAGGDTSGESVSLSSDGERVAIGAPNNDGAGIQAGHVRVLALPGSVIFTDGFETGDTTVWSLTVP